jgi:dienelactone hydrolase
VFAPNAAEDIMADYPQIQHWAVGGHSLGGAMAANYAYQFPDRVEGLILWASYPASNNNLTDSTLKVVSISASNDGLATPEKIVSSRTLLPADTTWVVVEGGVHAQFGSYDIQPGDGVPSITSDEQWAQTIQATTALLAIMSNP